MIGSRFKGHTAGKDALVEASMKYAQALKSLMDAQEYIDLGRQHSDSDAQRCRKLLLSVYLNLAVVSIMLESPDHALNAGLFL